MDTYEKKYKDANNKVAARFGTNVAKEIFTDLYESEDERILEIIKHCIESRYLHTSTIKGISQKQCFAWLEKQGEKPQGKTYTFEGKSVLEAIDNINNLEPKFKVGDWVVYECGEDSATLQIKNIIYRTYEFTDDSTLNVVDEDTLRLWTIQDAKDGDVLACPLPKGYEDREQIFIFKGINSRDYVENCIEYYCRICDGVFYVNENGYMGTTSSPLYPATKSQRDTLFAKMKEAGFEWDSEKKELKKISQHMISAEAKEAMYDKPTDNDMVEALRTEYEKGRADVLRCIDPDEMVADFYSQPLSKARSLASIYRQGIMDILKRINNNEKTSITSTRSIDDGGL